MSTYNFSKQELIENPSFRNWVEGRSSERERKFWDQWIMEDPANRILAMRVQEETEGFALNPAGDTSTDEAWNRIQSHLDRDHNTGRENVLPYKRFKTKKLTWTVRIAASFLLIIFSGYLITYLYQPSENNVTEELTEEITTHYGEQKTVRLSDGSEIILNGHSSMRYSASSDNPTAVDLFLEGEAYFSISKRKNPGDSHFQVRTEDGLIKVLGTQFVVSTHNGQTRVALKEGRVAINPFHLNGETILQPGQLGEFSNESNLVKTESVNMELYTSWIYGRLYFEKASIERVADRLKNIFGVDVVVRDSSLYNYKISGSIETTTLEIITSALSQMLNTPIYLSDSEKVIYVGDLK